MARCTLAWTASFAALGILCASLGDPAEAAVSKRSATVKAPAAKPAASVTRAKAPIRKVKGVDVQEFSANGLPLLKSAAALVVDMNDNTTLYDKNARAVTPIASITKLMTAMVALDAELPLDEAIQISFADFDFLKNTTSRLAAGTTLSRRDLLKLALMSSENRAAAAIGRSYPGGTPAFVAAMNRKALELGMTDSRFADATGLSSENVSTAQDLVKLVKGAYQYPLIREYTTSASYGVETTPGRSVQYGNSNGLVKSADWEIGLSKTGFISEAGRCLVMQAKIAARPVVIVLLDSWGKYTRTADAIRIKKWLESNLARQAPRASESSGLVSVARAGDDASHLTSRHPAF